MITLMKRTSWPVRRMVFIRRATIGGAFCAGENKATNNHAESLARAHAAVAATSREGTCRNESWCMNECRSRQQPERESSPRAQTRGAPEKVTLGVPRCRGLRGERSGDDTSREDCVCDSTTVARRASLLRSRERQREWERRRCRRPRGPHTHLHIVVEIEGLPAHTSSHSRPRTREMPAELALDDDGRAVLHGAQVASPPRTAAVAAVASVAAATRLLWRARLGNHHRLERWERRGGRCARRRRVTAAWRCQRLDSAGALGGGLGRQGRGICGCEWVRQLGGSRACVHRRACVPAPAKRVRHAVMKVLSSAWLGCSHCVWPVR
jgi:hypothetical protein